MLKKLHAKGFSTSIIASHITTKGFFEKYKDYQFDEITVTKILNALYSRDSIDIEVELMKILAGYDQSINDLVFAISAIKDEYSNSMPAKARKEYMDLIKQKADLQQKKESILEKIDAKRNRVNPSESKPTKKPLSSF